MKARGQLIQRGKYAGGRWQVGDLKWTLNFNTSYRK